MAGRLILGIESSCDETSAAVVAEGRVVLSNVVASQMVHAHYGGVVPELASREHLRAVVPVVREAMHAAGLEAYGGLSAVAVTEGPGLAGALLVGINFAKALAFGAGVPLVAVNHLEGHVQAVLLEAEERFAEVSPLLAAVVSGGHSHLYLAERDASGLWHYRNVGRTVDDAAGEAYDKVAKLLGLPYPGGPWMDVLAGLGDVRAIPFAIPQIKQKATGHRAPTLRGASGAGATGDQERGAAGNQERGAAGDQERGAAGDQERFDFSFSGLKTGVRRYVDSHGMRDRIATRESALRHARLLGAKPSMPGALEAVRELLDRETLDLIAGFQQTVVTYLAKQVFAAARHFNVRGVLVSGGVSANRLLRERFRNVADSYGLPVAFPSVALSTDNAAMIAAAAWPKFLNGRFAGGGLEAAPGLRLG